MLENLGNLIISNKTSMVALKNAKAPFANIIKYTYEFLDLYYILKNNIVLVTKVIMVNKNQIYNKTLSIMFSLWMNDYMEIQYTELNSHSKLAYNCYLT
jgi:hypothetical protein